MVSEIDRTVKVRWSHECLGESIDQSHILKLFSTFGRIETVHQLKPKLLRMDPKRKKQLASICMIQYASVIGAHAAVEDFPKQTGPAWSVFESVNWAANREPDFIGGNQTSDVESAPSTPLPNGSKIMPSAYSNANKDPSTPLSFSNGAENGPRKMPSFSSFSAGRSPQTSPFTSKIGVSSPSLEELTMIRLRNAEKKRLADEIRRQDEEAV